MKRLILLIVCMFCLFSVNVHGEMNFGDCNTVSSDMRYYYVVLKDGTLYRCSYDSIDKNEPIKKRFMDNVVSVEQNYALKEDGTLWTWDYENFQSVFITDNVYSFSVGSDHILIIKQDQSLWGMGNNSYGQLAQGKMDKSLEKQIIDDLKWKNKTESSPGYYDEPVKIMDDVKSAAADYTVSEVLKNDGTVWTFGGDQGCGTLGIGGKWLVNNEPTKILSEMKEIFLKGGAGFAIDNDDTLWRWGSNYIGYAGGNPGDLLIPEKYIENVRYAANMPGYNLIIKTDNSLWIYGDTNKDNGDIGYTSSDEPVKLVDDVVYAEGVSQEYSETPDNDKILVLKENGDLLLFAIPLYEDKLPYEAGKIMGNIKLPDETPILRNFSDISNKSEEMQTAINSLAKAGIISGVTDVEFAPDKPITRAEIAALLLRMTVKEEESGNGGFEDVTPETWYYHTAGASKKYGIVSGYDDNTFRGNEEISKIHMITLAARTLRTERAYNDIMYDELPVPEWAKDDVSLAVFAGLADKEENFDGDITRGEAAVILYRLYELI
jgi:hypothetical protein